MYAGLCDVQAQRRAAEKWKDKDETIRSLLFCALSALFKLECCSNASNSMDDIDLAGFCTYESLSGLDCKIQGFVLQYFLNVIFTCHTLLCSPVMGLHTVFTVHQPVEKNNKNPEE